MSDKPLICHNSKYLMLSLPAIADKFLIPPSLMSSDHNRGNVKI